MFISRFSPNISVKKWFLISIFVAFLPNFSVTFPNVTIDYGSLDDREYITNEDDLSYPVPFDKRGLSLTFAETGRESTFMMLQGNSFIHLNEETIPTFQLRLCREISFQFRTRLPHGLLVYHSVKDRPLGLPPYALYIIVEKGQLKVVHVYGNLTSVTVGKGLNNDKWHSVKVTIDVLGNHLLAKVDGAREVVTLKGLNPKDNYGVDRDLESVVLIGGLSPEETLHGVKYIIESFVGCMRNIVLSSGKALPDMSPITPLISAKHENVHEGCTNLCHTEENVCFFGSKCVNHYYYYSCDCFGTHYEGTLCDEYKATILTLDGSSYVSYRIYDWKDKVHSPVNRIGIQFKTRFDDSVLLYASGEHEHFHYVAATLVNGSVVVDFEVGDNRVITKILGEKVTDNRWNNLTIYHCDNKVDITLNDIKRTVFIYGSINYLYLDPEVYFGGGPKLKTKPGLRSFNNFVGSLKYIFFNDISILYELKKDSPRVHYIGLLDARFAEIDIKTIPITLPFPSAHIWYYNEYVDHLIIQLEFRSYKNLAVIASSETDPSVTAGFWEIRMVNEEVRFEFMSNVAHNITQLISLKLDRSEWHRIKMEYGDGRLTVNVDSKNKTAKLLGSKINVASKIIIGSGVSGKSNIGLIGCIRNIKVNDIPIEPRAAVQSNQTYGAVSIDNCKFVDPCKKPDACKHGGKCSVREDSVLCDCTETGYIGKNCHFARFRKTCEELALLGYTKPDVYLIDIDGNGKYPPAHVKCEFQSLEDWKTKTIVEHNLPSQVDVRSAVETDFSFEIKYREFTAEMLMELISHSLYCSQYVKYDCYKAPLELHSSTWFTSAANETTIDYIGEVMGGSCPCSVNKTCILNNVTCNCDALEDKWYSDEGFYTSPINLGIINMVFLQREDLRKDAIGRITLGALECVEANTQKYVVTFTTSQSYIEVPGWRKGEIAFSFRTTGEKAILLYQPPIRPRYPSFVVVLTSDFELTFNFTLNTGDSKELEIKSRRKLNGGEWQKIWIDYNKHHVRFMINTDYQMVDLQHHEEFGPFEGSMFIGGAVEYLSVKGIIYPGLVGCFRGLVVNGEILDIYSYMSVHLSEIIKECKPKCVPNPCKNGAHCKELWNRFECICQNPWTYSGTFCEDNINVDGMTFTTPSSYIKKSFMLNNITDPEKFLYTEVFHNTILMNVRTYGHNQTLLYANDHVNNFIHFFIQNGKAVVFLFNYGREIRNITVEHEGIDRGSPLQIALLRNRSESILHINNVNGTIGIGVRLLSTYSSRPWKNPRREILAPQRPPAPPSEYLQINVGGYDNEHLRFVNKRRKYAGFVGCMMGFKIGDYVPHLERHIEQATNTINDTKKILIGCRMKCDEKPCKNRGLCIENFGTGQSRCDCEHTSYYGQFCTQEKGADFAGDSVIQRKFSLESPLQDMKLQMAFSTSDARPKKTAILLLRTNVGVLSKKSVYQTAWVVGEVEGRPRYFFVLDTLRYYLLIALGVEGELIFEEDREDYNGAIGAHIRNITFINGARHSIYYQKIANSTFLMVDHTIIEIGPIPFVSYSGPREDDKQNSSAEYNEVQIGGVNTADPRFTSYKRYRGCLSNVYIEVNKHLMKPLEEYMMFTMDGSEKVNVTNSHGIRSAQCSSFDITHKLKFGPSLNISFGWSQPWAEDPPERLPFAKLSSNTLQMEEYRASRGIILTSIILILFVIAVSYDMYRVDQRYRKQKDIETAKEALRDNPRAAIIRDSIFHAHMARRRRRSHYDVVRLVREDSQCNALIRSRMYNQYFPDLPPQYAFALAALISRHRYNTKYRQFASPKSRRQLDTNFVEQVIPELPEPTDPAPSTSTCYNQLHSENHTQRIKSLCVQADVHENHEK